MISYSETDVFRSFEIALMNQAIRIVHAIRERATPLRCHEVARAAGIVLNLPVQDGFYGIVDHSWLWTRLLVTDRDLTSRFGIPSILDVYCVGRLPQVSLVSTTESCLPHIGWSYRPSEQRTDIDQKLVDTLCEEMRSAL